MPLHHASNLQVVLATARRDKFYTHGLVVVFENGACTPLFAFDQLFGARTIDLTTYGRDDMTHYMEELRESYNPTGKVSMVSGCGRSAGLRIAFQYGKDNAKAMSQGRTNATLCALQSLSCMSAGLTSNS